MYFSYEGLKTVGKKNIETQKPFPKIHFDKMLNGAVCASHVKCGKPNCKCARGILHGPYYHRYQWYDGRVIKEYIRLRDVKKVRAACKRYRALQMELLEGRRHHQLLMQAFRRIVGGLKNE